MSINTCNVSITPETNKSVATRVLQLYDLAVKQPTILSSLVNFTGSANKKDEESQIDSDTYLTKAHGFGDFDNWGNFSSWR
ncbi:MAG: hypothetical protein EA343_18320 [Nodularia sp. (in: Bacteria)]|nr:MAG: hypothetical protein EA343_18320 [Nodularia sp. (in: cyanobacteria)]